MILSAYKENFEIVYRSNKWKMNVKKALSSDIFNKMSEIVTTMEAKEKGVSGKGVGVLVIELVSSNTDNAPKFDNPYYIVQYKKDRTGLIDFNPAVAFKNYNDFSKMSINLTSKYFEYTNNYLL